MSTIREILDEKRKRLIKSIEKITEKPLHELSKKEYVEALKKITGIPFFFSYKYGDYEHTAETILKDLNFDKTSIENFLNIKIYTYNEYGFKDIFRRFRKYITTSSVNISFDKGASTIKRKIKRIASIKKYKYVQQNPYYVKYLIIDIDHNFFEYYMEYRDILPPPTFIILNPYNFHAHVFYELETPVIYASNNKQPRQHPIDLFEKTHFVLTKIWEGDFNYTPKKLTKNPFYDPNYRKLTEEERKTDYPYLIIIPNESKTYSLSELAMDYLEINSLEYKLFKEKQKSYRQTIAKDIFKKQQIDIIHEGTRNQTLFEIGRRLGYKYAFDYNGDYKTIFNTLMEDLWKINYNYCSPQLSYTEIRGIVKSITRYVYENYKNGKLYFKEPKRIKRLHLEPIKTTIYKKITEEGLELTQDEYQKLYMEEIKRRLKLGAEYTATTKRERTSKLIENSIKIFIKQTIEDIFEALGLHLAYQEIFLAPVREAYKQYKKNPHNKKLERKFNQLFRQKIAQPIIETTFNIAYQSGYYGKYMYNKISTEQFLEIMDKKKKEIFFGILAGLSSIKKDFNLKDLFLSTIKKIPTSISNFYERYADMFYTTLIGFMKEFKLAGIIILKRANLKLKNAILKRCPNLEEELMKGKIKDIIQPYLVSPP